MSKLQIRTPEAFAPLLEPARYKGAWGGRGSGKSHFFAELGLEDALRYPGDHGCGLRWLCVREHQKSLKESAKALIESKLERYNLGAADGFKVYREVIETPKDGLIVFTGMKDHTADSVKSYEGFHRAWCEEAHSLSDKSLTLLRPTIRAEGSQLWFSWNPSRPTDPVDKMLRGANRPSEAIVIRANWSDNPWFPSVLDQERRDCLENQPERYEHIWNGDYATVWEGAYFARHLTVAEQEGRIGELSADPLISRYAFWDIGGTSDQSDATAIWIAQFVGDQVRVLDYYEAIGQPFEAHVNWLRANGYGDIHCVLPHDGRKHDIVYSVTPQRFLGDAGFGVTTVENQGRGAAMQRVDALRRIFNTLWFHRERTKGGREAVGWYHERKDENREIGLGPEHDWSSHAADALGLMAIWRLANPASTGWSDGPLRRNMKGIA